MLAEMASTMSSRVGSRRALEQRVAGEDHARGAVAALHAVGFAERILQDAELAGAGVEAFDGSNLDAVGLHREHQAGSRWLAVDQDGAGAAHPVLAAGVRAREADLLAQAVQQRAPRLDVDGHGRGR